MCFSVRFRTSAVVPAATSETHQLPPGEPIAAADHAQDDPATRRPGSSKSRDTSSSRTARMRTGLLWLTICVTTVHTRATVSGPLTGRSPGERSQGPPWSVAGATGRPAVAGGGGAAVVVRVAAGSSGAAARPVAGSSAAVRPALRGAGAGTLVGTPAWMVTVLLEIRCSRGDRSPSPCRCASSPAPARCRCRTASGMLSRSWCWPCVRVDRRRAAVAVERCR